MNADKHRCLDIFFIAFRRRMW